MLFAMQGAKLCAHCYTWSEALCSLLHAVKLYAQRFTTSEAICSLLYNE